MRTSKFRFNLWKNNLLENTWWMPDTHIVNSETDSLASDSPSRSGEIPWPWLMWRTLLWIRDKIDHLLRGNDFFSLCHSWLNWKICFKMDCRRVWLDDFRTFFGGFHFPGQGYYADRLFCQLIFFLSIDRCWTFCRVMSHPAISVSALPPTFSLGWYLVGIQ